MTESVESLTSVADRDRTTGVSAAAPLQVGRPRPGWRSPGPTTRKVLTFLLPVAAAVILVVIWWAIARPSIIASYLLPGPQSVWDSIKGSDNSGLIGALWITLRQALIGFACAITLGLLIAGTLVQFPLVSRVVYPFLISSQTIPIPAIAPLLVIWFGFGDFPKVLVVILFGFFPIAINTIAGMRSVDRDTLLLMRSLGASRWDVLRLVRFPAALPRLFVGVKIAAVGSVIGAVVAEWVGAAGGIGVVMIAANSQLETNIEFAAMFYLSAVALILYGLVTLTEHRTIGWYFLSTKAES
jgi:ABC-type nitrate/sulfonate/bicarbonate transport system permease component